MTKTELAKTIVTRVAGVSTTFCVANIIKNNTTPQNKLQSAEVWVGAFALGSIVSDRVETHVSDGIDKITEAFQKAKTS